MMSVRSVSLPLGKMYHTEHAGDGRSCSISGVRRQRACIHGWLFQNAPGAIDYVGFLHNPNSAPLLDFECAEDGKGRARAVPLPALFRCASGCSKAAASPATLTACSLHGLFKRYTTTRELRSHPLF